jgi:acyl transferase domain-containing protein
VTRCPGTDHIFKLPSLQQGRRDVHVVAAAAAALYAAGVTLDWTNLLGPAERVVLPTYPFERERYWADPVPPAAVWDRQQAQEHGGLHPLLGRRVDLADRPRHAAWDVTIANDEVAYLGDHRIHGTVAVPMSVYLELARAASAELLGLGTHILTDLELRTPLLLGDGPAPAIQLILAPDEAGNTAFRLYSRRSAGRQPWTMHAVATIRTSLADAI